jgi:hypothetical protein
VELLGNLPHVSPGHKLILECHLDVSQDMLLDHLIWHQRPDLLVVYFDLDLSVFGDAVDVTDFLQDGNIVPLRLQLRLLDEKHNLLSLARCCLYYDFQNDPLVRHDRDEFVECVLAQEYFLI